MYKNRISRTPVSHDPQFLIRRADIAYDERMAFVESVCQTLIESRFGPGSNYEALPVVINLGDRSELEPAVFYDFDHSDPNGLVSFYTLPFLGRAGYQVVEAAYRRAKQVGLLDAAPNARNSTSALTPNQGRGSP